MLCPIRLLFIFIFIFPSLIHQTVFHFHFSKFNPSNRFSFTCFPVNTSNRFSFPFSHFQPQGLIILFCAQSSIIFRSLYQSDFSEVQQIQVQHDQSKGTEDSQNQVNYRADWRTGSGQTHDGNGMAQGVCVCML